MERMQSLPPVFFHPNCTTLIKSQKIVQSAYFRGKTCTVLSPCSDKQEESHISSIEELNEFTELNINALSNLTPNCIISLMEKENPFSLFDRLKPILENSSLSLLEKLYNHPVLSFSSFFINSSLMDNEKYAKLEFDRRLNNGRFDLSERMCQHESIMDKIIAHPDQEELFHANLYFLRDNTSFLLKIAPTCINDEEKRKLYFEFAHIRIPISSDPMYRQLEKKIREAEREELTAEELLIYDKYIEESFFNKLIQIDPLYIQYASPFIQDLLLEKNIEKYTKKEKNSDIDTKELRENKFLMEQLYNHPYIPHFFNFRSSVLMDNEEYAHLEFDKQIKDQKDFYIRQRMLQHQSVIDKIIGHANQEKLIKENFYFLRENESFLLQIAPSCIDEKEKRDQYFTYSHLLSRAESIEAYQQLQEKYNETIIFRETLQLRDQTVYDACIKDELFYKLIQIDPVYIQYIHDTTTNSFIKTE